MKLEQFNQIFDNANSLSTNPFTLKIEDKGLQILSGPAGEVPVIIIDLIFGEGEEDISRFRQLVLANNEEEARENLYDSIIVYLAWSGVNNYTEFSKSRI